MSFKTAAIITATAVIAVSGSAQADIFSRLNKAMTDVENTISNTESTIDRATGTAERLNNTAPEAGAEKIVEETPAAATTPQITAEEEEILRKAREIEQRNAQDHSDNIRTRLNQRNAR